MLRPKAEKTFQENALAIKTKHQDSTMKPYTTEELTEALRALTSTISKCEKVQPKLRVGTSQHTLLVRRIRALTIAVELIQKELTDYSTNAPKN